MIAILFLSFLALGSAWAEPLPPLPLPGQSLHMHRGILASMGLGRLTRTGCQSLTQWQGAAQYSYHPNISGGGAFRLYGGPLDDNNAVTYNRYFVNTRFHFRTRDVDIYLGPVLGLDNTSLRSIRSDLQSLRDPDTENPDSTFAQSGLCNDLFAVGGVGVGYDMGLGWAIHPAWAWLFQHSLEFSLRGQSNFIMGSGFAFDLRRYWPRVRPSAQALWLYLEGVATLDVRSLSSDNSLLGGVAVGF